MIDQSWEFWKAIKTPFCRAGHKYHQINSQQQQPFWYTDSLYVSCTRPCIQLCCFTVKTHALATSQIQFLCFVFCISYKAAILCLSNYMFPCLYDRTKPIVMNLNHQCVMISSMTKAFRQVSPLIYVQCWSTTSIEQTFEVTPK